MGMCMCQNPIKTPLEKKSIYVDGFSSITTTSKVRTNLSNDNLSILSLKNKPILTKLLKGKRIQSQTNIKISQFHLSKN